MAGSYISTPNKFGYYIRTNSPNQIMTIEGLDRTDIDWGDGTVSEHVSNVASHTYVNAGAYLIQLTNIATIYVQTIHFAPPYIELLNVYNVQLLPTLSELRCVVSPI